MAYVTIVTFGHTVHDLWCYCSHTFKLFVLPIFGLWEYFLKVIAETGYGKVFDTGLLVWQKQHIHFYTCTIYTKVDNACEDQWPSGLVDIVYSRVLKNNEVHVIDQLNVRCTGLIGFLTCHWFRYFWIQIKYKNEHLCVSDW